MPKKKKRPGRRFPPCPFPEGGIPVSSKEGNYWKRKRGTVKPAVLNASFSRNAEAAKIVSPAAKRLVSKLYPYLQGLFPGRLIARLSGKFFQSFNKTGSIHFDLLDLFDFQPDWPFEDLCKANYTLTIADGTARLQIPIGRATMVALNNLVSGYYFELILLYGDVTKERSLRVESVESPLYDYNFKGNTKCQLELILPGGGKPWMLLLKVNSQEGNQMAAHGKHYGLKVIRVGGK